MTTIATVNNQDNGPYPMSLLSSERQWQNRRKPARGVKEQGKYGKLCGARADSNNSFFSRDRRVVVCNVQCGMVHSRKGQ
jgi:hypothetical protein